MKKKNKKFEKLEISYLLVLFLGALIIAPTHIFPQPYFMYARFPHYLEMMKPFLGISWPESFEIYHKVLYVLAITISLNAGGIVFYPRFKKITAFSSMFGVLLFSLITLFFFLKFINVNFSTAVVLGLYSLIVTILSYLTFKALTKQKGA